MACTDRMSGDTGGICCNDVKSFFLGLELVVELCPSVLEYMHLINVFVLHLYDVVYTRLWLSRHYQWLFVFLR